VHLKKLRQAEGGAKIVGVFRVKNHDFTPKNHIFFPIRASPLPLDPPLAFTFIKIINIRFYNMSYTPNIIIYEIKVRYESTEYTTRPSWW
jgi:hypothetical protein